MTLNYDCCCEIAKYLKNFDHLRFCKLLDIKIRTENVTDKHYVVTNVMTLFKLKADVLAMIKDINWNCVSKDVILFEEFMYEFDTLHEWDHVFHEYDNIFCDDVVFPHDFPREYRKEFDNGNAIWFYISSRFLSEEFIRTYKDYVNWYAVSKYQSLSESFLEEFKDRVDWNFIAARQTLSMEFIRKYKNLVNWTTISHFQTLSEGFIREYKNYVDWIRISQYQTLSEEFIREFRGSVNWTFISEYQKLSAEFIKEFATFVSWNHISLYQDLSVDLIKEFKNKVNWENLRKNPKLSKQLVRKLSIWRVIHPAIPYVRWVGHSRIFRSRIMKLHIFKIFLNMSSSAMSCLITRLLSIDDLDF